MESINPFLKIAFAGLIGLLANFFAFTTLGKGDVITFFLTFMILQTAIEIFEEKQK